MGSEWSEEFLEDLADEITVGFVGSMTSEYVEKGIPFLRSKNVDPLTINTDDLKFISSEFDQRISKSHLQPGDVVIVRTGKPGTCAVVPEWLTAANCSDLVIVRCNSKIDSHFLAYYVNEAAAGHVNAHLVGAVQQHFNVASARKLRVRLPPPTEQARIVNVLRVFDKKVELNRQTNQTLESMSQALFKSWFVDFDPVIDNALAAGNEIPEPLAARAAARRALREQGADKTNQLHALPEHIRQLFPSRFQLTEELGWIPEGWEIKPLDQVAHYQNGLALQKFRPNSENDEYLPVLKIAHLKQGSTDGKEKAATTIKPECIVNDGDVVFSWSGSLMVDIWSGGKAALNQHLFKVTSNHFPKWFYYHFTKNHLEEFIRIAADKAVTMGHIKREHLSRALCVVPDSDILKQGTLVVGQLIDKQLQVRSSNTALTDLRDALLPKLLSGELRIPEAEKVLDEALV